MFAITDFINDSLRTAVNSRKPVDTPLYREKNDEVRQVRKLLRQHLNNFDPRSSFAQKIGAIAGSVGGFAGAAGAVAMGFGSNDVVAIGLGMILGATISSLVAQTLTIALSTKPRAVTRQAFARLAQYDPIDVDAYQKLQHRIGAEGLAGRMTGIHIEEWIEEELSAIEKLRYESNGGKHDHAQHNVDEFLNRKF